MVTMPNQHYRDDEIVRIRETAPEEYAENLTSSFEQRAESLLLSIQANGPIRRQALEKIWGVSRSTATNWLNQLIDAGILVRIGSGRNTRYTQKEYRTAPGK
jgi:predicted HTH transcriptional regulator